MKATCNSIFILLFIFLNSTALAQEADKPYKIKEGAWLEVTHNFKVGDKMKGADARYAVDAHKEVLGGGILVKRTIYSNSSCNCILMVINYTKGEPTELIDYLFKFKKHYSRDKNNWRFEKREDRVGYSRCK